MADEMEDEIDVEGFDEKDGPSSSTLLPSAASDTVPLTKECKIKDHITSQIWSEYDVPVCDWSLDEMDHESRLTIENMLHEERQYLQCSNGPFKRSKKKSSPYLRWTPQERLQFEKGFMSFGNRWTQIARMIPTRSPLQVKNYARYYFPTKLRSKSSVNAVEKQDPIDQEVIHSHLPESLNTGSPTVATRIKLPNMRNLPHPSKRRHFQKFGFANLSPSRLLKSRSGKDMLASIKLSKVRSAPKLKKASVEGSRSAKMHKTHRLKRAQGKRTKKKSKDRTAQDLGGSWQGRTKGVSCPRQRDLFDQGGGVVRMRPESSEDEDVDVDVEGVDKHQNRSLIGLAATCDRIYSNLITPFEGPAHSAQAITAQDVEIKMLSDFPQPATKDQRVIPEGFGVRELAWNADHTYSMSLKTLHRLGILKGVRREPQENTLQASTSHYAGHLSYSVDSNPCSETKAVIMDDLEDVCRDEKILPPKSETIDSSDKLCFQELETDLDESDLQVQEVETPEHHVEEELCTSSSDHTSALDSHDAGQPMGLCQSIESAQSEEQVVTIITETPARNSPEVDSTDPVIDDSAAGACQVQEVNECETSEESKPVSGSPLSTSTTPLENNPIIPEKLLEIDCEMVGPYHEGESRGATKEEGKEASDATQKGGTDDNGCEDTDSPTGPKTERFLTLDEIEEWEKRAIPEFFEGRPSKTPERYLKIRNYIYQHWLQIKPKYLNKSTVRLGLKSCGDVNSIGRIHRSLEMAGAINAGVENPHKAVINCRANAIRQRLSSNSNCTDQQKTRRESTRTRKKREMDFEVVTQPSEEKPLPRKSVRTGPRKSKLMSYDPFKLIECCKFTQEKDAPFHVRIQSDAMIIMDVHSHMSSTEVIGLLGGRFLKEDSILDVFLAVPCNSISTGMQCEMDPVSQTEAYESILAKGYQVVGWYHSHPAFAANPSVRDIETQSEFQGWFSQGGAPFIGVIVSPCHNYQISQSKVCCLTISKEWSSELKCRKPYQFDFTVSHSHCDSNNTMNIISGLVSKFAAYQFRSEMLYLWSRHYDVSFLEKMLLSIKTYMCPSRQGDLLNRIRNLVTAEFTTQTIATAEEEVRH